MFMYAIRRVRERNENCYRIKYIMIPRQNSSFVDVSRDVVACFIACCYCWYLGASRRSAPLGAGGARWRARGWRIRDTRFVAYAWALLPSSLCLCISQMIVNHGLPLQPNLVNPDSRRR